MTDFASMSRTELRAYLRANDPQKEHWLKRANHLLTERLEVNRVEHGWPSVTELVVEPVTVLEPVRNAPEPYEPHGRFGGVAL